MAIRSKKLKKSPPLTVDDFLRSVPVANVSMKVEGRADGSALVSIPMRRPGWLVPPLTWILPYSSHRRVELDPVGAGVLQLLEWCPQQPWLEALRGAAAQAAHGPHSRDPASRNTRNTLENLVST